MSKFFIVPYRGTMTVEANSREEAYKKAINKDSYIDDIKVNENDIYAEYLEYDDEDNENEEEY